MRRFVHSFLAAALIVAALLVAHRGPVHIAVAVALVHAGLALHARRCRDAR